MSLNDTMLLRWVILQRKIDAENETVSTAAEH
jgi:hypothetical protein